MKQIDKSVNCAKCNRRVCNSPVWQDGPDNCPIKMLPEVISQATEKCLSPKNQKFALEASKQEGSGYTRLPHAPKSPSPIKSRVEEIMEFARRMDYRKIGIAYCAGVQFEAGLLIPILENRGFDVISVSCKCGSVPKENLGIQDSEKILPGHFEAMCHPIAQAEILNHYETDYNVVLCLCVGHDSIFLKHSKAPCTVLAAKDRVFGHAPLMGVYQSRSYHRRVMAKDDMTDIEIEEKHKPKRKKGTLKGRTSVEESQGKSKSNLGKSPK